MLIVNAQICPQYRSRFRVPGYGGELWDIDFVPYSGQHYCKCPEFKNSAENFSDRYCEHVDAVRRHGCFYVSDVRPPGPNDLHLENISITWSPPQDRLEKRCPGCGEQLMIGRGEI